MTWTHLMCLAAVAAAIDLCVRSLRGVFCGEREHRRWIGRDVAADAPEVDL